MQYSVIKEKNIFTIQNVPGLNNAKRVDKL